MQDAKRGGFCPSQSLGHLGKRGSLAEKGMARSSSCAGTLLRDRARQCPLGEQQWGGGGGPCGSSPGKALAPEFPDARSPSRTAPSPRVSGRYLSAELARRSSRSVPEEETREGGTGSPQHGERRGGLQQGERKAARPSLSLRKPGRDQKDAGGKGRELKPRRMVPARALALLSQLLLCSCRSTPLFSPAFLRFRLPR